MKQRIIEDEPTKRILAVMLSEEIIGVRFDEFIRRTPLRDAAIEHILRHLINDNIVKCKEIPTATGGTVDTFYQLVDRDSITIVIN